MSLEQQPAPGTEETSAITSSSPVIPAETPPAAAEPPVVQSPIVRQDDDQQPETPATDIPIEATVCEVIPQEADSSVESPAAEVNVSEQAVSEQAVSERPVSAATEPEAQTAITEPEAQTAITEPEAQTAITEPEAQNVEAPRKLQLNPTLPSGKPRAVPSLENAAGPSAEVVPDRGPVEIPQLESLDDDLESQLNAALSGDTSPRPPASESGLPEDESALEPGTKFKGKVESIDDENVLVDLGYRSSGVLSRRHFPEGKLPEAGSQLDVVVESINAVEGVINLGLLRSAHRAGGDWNSLAVGQVVECTVQKTNKGGLEVLVSQLRGFMPAGQIDLGFIADMETYVGQKLVAKVIDLNPKKRNLVVSRKALLMEEREILQTDAWETLQEGDQHTGTVKTIKDYGAFIDIGGVDGLLHVRELSWTRVNHPSDVLQEGQQVDVKILALDKENKKISLGMKQLMTNPWDYAEQKYPKNSIVTGVVKKVTEFGAFIEIEPGLEGLIHISELDHRRVSTVNEVLKQGQETEAQVIEVNKNKKRISLSLKSLKSKPQPSAEQVAARQEEQKEAEQRRQEDLQRRKTLKGGIGGNKPGGLFGNPSDF